MSPANTPSAACSTCRKARLAYLASSRRDAAAGILKGRTGIHELVLVDDTMRTMIHDGSSEQELDERMRAP